VLRAARRGRAVTGPNWWKSLMIASREKMAERGCAARVWTRRRAGRRLTA